MTPAQAIWSIPVRNDPTCTRSPPRCTRSEREPAVPEHKLGRSNGQILTQAAPSTGHLLLDQFLERAMAKHPADRHSTVAQFIEHFVAVQPSMADTHGSVLSPNSAADSQILDNAGAVSAPTMVAPENQRAHEHPTIGAQSLDNLSDSGTLHNSAQIGGPLGQPIALPNSEVASGRDRLRAFSPLGCPCGGVLSRLYCSTSSKPAGHGCRSCRLDRKTLPTQQLPASWCEWKVEPLTLTISSGI